MSRLLKDQSYKHIVHRAADIDNVDDFFNAGRWAELKAILTNPKDDHATENAREYYYQHKQDMAFPVLWPDKYDCLDLAVNDYYPNPTAFKQELQNDVSKIGARAFHSLTTMAVDEIEANDYELTVLCCDPAVNTGRTNDYTALAVAGKTANNFQYIRKGIIARYTFDQYVDAVVSLLEQYDDISVVYVERNTFNGADVREIKQRIAASDSLRHRNIEFINTLQRANKENKIRAIGGKVDSGFIIFNLEDTAFNEQVQTYEGETFSAHDDAPDVVAECVRLLETCKPVAPSVQLMDLSILGL